MMLNRRFYQGLRRDFDARRRDNKQSQFFEDVNQAMTDGHFKPEELSLRMLFEEFVDGGRELVESFDPRNRGGAQILLEEGPVNTAAFSSITGQMIYNSILQAYEKEGMVFSKVVPTRQLQWMDGEKIPGITGLDQVAEEVTEGGNYPRAGVSEDWIETPRSTKRGLIVEVTKEAIFKDQTGLLLQRCGQVGEVLAINKENRIIDCVIDENVTTHRYKWKGTSYATYQASSPWINVVSSNALVDWTDIDNAEALFSNMVDPWTGEPISIVPKDIIFTRDLLYTARRVISATEITVTTPGYATSGNPTEHRMSNPVQDYRMLTSARLKSRLATDSTWFIGDIAKAFRYGELWPLSVVQAPSNSEAEFERDVVSRYKASEHGVCETHEPRAMVKCTA